MHSRRLTKRFGYYFGIALVLGALFMPVAINIWKPAVAHAGTPSFAWQAAQPYNCLSTISGTHTADAYLIYTDINGTQHTFECANITQGGKIKIVNQMLLVQASSPDACTVQVGNVPPTNSDVDYTVATVAQFNQNQGTCPNLGQPTTMNIGGPVYNQIKFNPVVGTAYWSKIDPLNPIAVLNATFDNLGSYKTSTKEVFTQSSINGYVMVLTGTKVGPGCSSSQQDTIEIGLAGVNQTYWQDTVATLTTYVPGHDEGTSQCIPAQGLISLVDQKTGQPESYIGAGGQDPTQSGNNSNNDSCVFDATPSLKNSINWLLCGIFALLENGTRALSGEIQTILFVDPNLVFGTAFQSAYDTFRNIALTVIILAGLVMVASQAAGLEIFSAYTVRKKLPAIVIAVIGLSLAWPILQFLVIFFNDLGSWVQSIILATVANVPAGQLGTTDGIITAVFSFVGGSVVLIGLGVAGLISLGFTMFLSLAVAFVTLIIRQIVVILCIMLAPLAIALSIIPGTEGLWKFWRSTLLGMLVMFPLAMGFLASGQAVSKVAAAAANGGGGSGWVYVLIAAIAAFLPYFFLPTALTLGGRLLGSVNGMLKAPLKPIFEGQAKRRAVMQAQNFHDFARGQRFNERGVLGSTAGRFGNFVGRRMGAGIGMPTTRRAAIANTSIMSADAYAKTDENFAANVNDANFLAAAAGFSEFELRRMGMWGDGSGFAKAQLIKRTPQARSAAMDALAKTGDFLGTKEQINRRANAIGVNSYARDAIKQSFEITSRSSGRPDLGKDDLGAAIVGMKAADISTLKTPALSRIFGDPRTPGSASPIGELVRTGSYGGTAINPQQQRNLAATLVAASLNLGASADQQNFVRYATAQARRTAPGATIMDDGETIYRSSKIGP